MNKPKTITPLRFSKHLKIGIASVSATMLLAAGMGVSMANAATPETCGSSGFCYAGYSAKGLKTIAEDLSANGENSQYYGEMKSAMDEDTRGTLKVTSTAIADNGKQVDMPVRLIGILHDDKADGTGKAGLTFQTYNSLPRAYCMNGVMPDDDSTTRCSGSDTNKGGWRDSALRRNMNSGEIWKSMPADLRDTVEPVVKETNNTVGNSKRAVSTGTGDRLWLVSYREYVKTLYDGWKDANGFQSLSQEGFQYGFYDGRVTNNYSGNTAINSLWAAPSGAKPAGANNTSAWERSLYPYSSGYFRRVSSNGDPSSSNIATGRYGVAPAFSL